MSRKTQFEVGEYYHIYNRGIEKRDIFLIQGDYDRFLALLYLCNSTESIRMPRDFVYNPKQVFSTKRKNTLVEICTYTLMPNHFHLLLREKEEGGLSTFMHKLTTAYTMYFNTHNDRSGALFQGTFKAKHSDTDEYLKYLIAYVHLNPVKLVEPKWKEEGIVNKKKVQDFLGTYKYSSFMDFNGIQRPENSVITIGGLPKYFETPISFKENLNEWLEYSWEH